MIKKRKMSSLLKPLFSITAFNGLSSERRRAYIKQGILAAVVFVALGITAIIVFSTSPDASEATRNKQKTGLAVFGLILYSIQLLHALIKCETIWQLRWRELQSIKGASYKNQQELVDFADKQGRVTDK
jgi:hypothetical protein